MNSNNIGEKSLAHGEHHMTPLQEKRIAAVRAALDAVSDKSEWGKNYWDGVLAYLLRAANRLN